METTTDISPTTTERPETIYGAFRPQTYYAIKKPSGFGYFLFVSVGLLIKRFGVSEKTIRNGISKFRNGLTDYYKTFLDKGALMLNYDQALPPNIKAPEVTVMDPVCGRLALSKPFTNKLSVAPS